MDFSLGITCDADRTFCTLEVIQGIGTSEHSVKKAVAALGITPEYAGTKGYLYTYSDYINIKAWIQTHVNSKKSNKQKIISNECKLSKSLEQLRAEHPLVKDDRCFNINWWPNTVPKVYEEIWNETD